jgi:hypothetical protein
MTAHTGISMWEPTLCGPSMWEPTLWATCFASPQHALHRTAKSVAHRVGSHNTHPIELYR